MWLKAKQRWCKFEVRAGSTCCYHQPVATTGSAAADGIGSAAGTAGENDRVACPLNPKHIVYRKNLKKHLKKCKASKPLPPPPSFHSQSINTTGPPPDATAPKPSLKDLSAAELQALIARVESAAAAHLRPVVEGNLKW